MKRTKLSFDAFCAATVPKLAAVSLLFVACLPATSSAQQAGQKTFASAEEASAAFVQATRNNDEKALLSILGPDGKRIVSSGDDAEDNDSRANFVQRYDEMHRLVKEPDGTTVLYIGAHNWPTPVPLVNKGQAWYFDTDAGKREILYRRIGRNEISAIRVCQELVAAEKEYFAQHKEYARKIFSDEGQRDGLYWKAESGEPQSPIGPLVAAAVPESFADRKAASSTPYRGYYFHILTGEKKDGKTKSYLRDGKMTEGFAFVAYPADYRSSGVVTFTVNQDGVVYEKDMGPKTPTMAKAMRDYTVSAGWQKSDGQERETVEKASQ
jgi:hypothetical protein